MIAALNDCCLMFSKAQDKITCRFLLIQNILLPVLLCQTGDNFIKPLPDRHLKPLY
jgi:hypothetical protein